MEYPSAWKKEYPFHGWSEGFVDGFLFNKEAKVRTRDDEDEGGMDTADYDRDDWLPLMEAARLMDKSPWSLYTLVRKGRIESSRIDHRIFVNMGSLFDYYKRRK